MSAEWVTIATFDQGVEASFAQDRLESAGIASELADEATVGLAWHMAQAMGGIKLRVDAADVERAQAVLAEEDLGVGAASPAFAELAADTEVSAIDTIDEADEAPPNERERTAERAFRCAVFGFLFWPIFLWATILVLRVWTSGQPWRPRYRRRARWAAFFAAVPWLVTLLFVLANYLPPSAEPESSPGQTVTSRYRA